MATKGSPDRFLTPFRADAASGIIKKDGGLTSLQHAQLAAAAASYRRVYQLRNSYQNAKNTAPVIGNCVLDGLEKLKHSRQVEPADSLSEAFKLGFGRRKQLIVSVQKELAGLTGDYALEGPLALPQPLIKASLTEMDQVVTLADIKAGKALAAEAEVRRPVYDKLLGFCRDEVEKLIPGSRAVVLTPVQEAGLVRNLVFEWVVNARPTVLLETGDFIADAWVFIRRQHDLRSSLEGLAEAVGLPGEQAQLYLADLAKQAAQVLEPMYRSPTSTTVLGEVRSRETVYKQLSKWFLLEKDPFYELPTLSLNPADREASVWDPGRSTVVRIDGEDFRVPLPATLNWLSSRISITDAVKSSELKLGAVRIGQLIAAILRAQNDTRLPVIRQQLEKAQDVYATQHEKMQTGEFLPGWTVGKGEILQYARDQVEVIGDELQFFDAVRVVNERYLAQAFTVLEKYRDDRTLDPADLNTIGILHFNPALITKGVLTLVRDRVAKRLRVQTELAEAEAIYMQSNAGPAALSSPWNRALEMTVVDVLSLRSKLWHHRYVSQTLTPSELRQLWKAVIERERRAAKFSLRRLAFENTPWSTKEERRLALEESNRILADSNHEISKRIARVNEWEELLRAGGLPRSHTISSNFIRWWRAEADLVIKRGLATWKPRVKLCAPLPDLEDIKITGDRRNTLEQLGAKPYGMARLAVGAICRLAPEELRPERSITLEEEANHLFPWHFRYPTVIATPSHQVGERERRVIFGEALRGYLSQRGFEWNDEVFKLVAPSQSKGELASHVHLYARFFGIEPEMRAWLTGVEGRVVEQTRQHQALLKYRPEEIMKSCAVDYETRKREVEARQQALWSEIRSRFKQLSATGLILSESGFQPRI